MPELIEDLAQTAIALYKDRDALRSRILKLIRDCDYLRGEMLQARRTLDTGGSGKTLSELLDKLADLVEGKPMEQGTGLPSDVVGAARTRANMVREEVRSIDSALRILDLKKDE